MATLAGVLISDKHSPFDSGAAFLLSQKCTVNEVVQPQPDWEIEIRALSPYVVARGIGASNAADAFNSAHEIAQQGLDLLSISGKADLTILNSTSECLIWWREDKLRILRAVSITELPIKVGPVEIVVKDQAGNVVQQPPIPQIIFHESFRYFRLSQTTDDLYDAFRNMYLSFELLLEHIVPKTERREGEWLKRALVTVNATVPLSRALTPRTSDIVQEIYDEIYIAIRCAIFHAKHYSYLLPHNLQDRGKVNEGLKKLTRIVLLLAENWLHARRGGGLITYYAFDNMTKPLLSDSEILISDVNLSVCADETLDSPAYVSAVAFPARFAPELSEPGLNCAIGAIDTSLLHSLKSIVRFGLKHETLLCLGLGIEAELTYEDFDRIEAQMGFQLRNVRQPKHLFKA
jgi:hypothetical protein